MRAFSVAKRLIKQIGGDKRSLAILFVAPIFVMFLFSVIFSSAAAKPNIDVVSAPDAFITALKEEAIVTSVEDEATALSDVKGGTADAYINFAGDTPKITIEGADPSITGLVVSTLNKVNQAVLQDKVKGLLQNIQKLVPAGSVPTITTTKPEINFVYGSEDMKLFDSIAPLMMGVFIFFFVFLLAGIAFLRERISGTLERILATPLRRREIVTGYFLGFGLFVSLQTVIIQSFMVYGLKISNAGSFWTVLIINLVLASGSLALGTLLSAFAENEFQLFQFIPVVIIPQILFSGIFDLRVAPQWVKILSQIFPMTYAADALREVMIRGKGLDVVYPDVLVLAGYAVVFLVLNTLVLKKYRAV